MPFLPRQGFSCSQATSFYNLCTAVRRIGVSFHCKEESSPVRIEVGEEDQSVRIESAGHVVNFLLIINF